MLFKWILTLPPKPCIILAFHSLHLALFFLLSSNILTKQASYFFLKYQATPCLSFLYHPFHLPGMFFPQSSFFHLPKFLHMCWDKLNPNLFEKLSWPHICYYPICHSVLELYIFLPRTFHISSDWMNHCVLFVLLCFVLCVFCFLLF